jgi:hypothetical protein
LLEDIREDLATIVDDAENRGVTERAAREMLAIRALVGRLEGGDPPGVDARGSDPTCVLRFATDAKFARLAGVAPVPASSGKRVRYRPRPRRQPAAELRAPPHRRHPGQSPRARSGAPGPQAGEGKSRREAL